MTTTKLTQCPKCGCKENESLGNDFHCKDCSYIQCGDEPTGAGMRGEFNKFWDSFTTPDGRPDFPDYDECADWWIAHLSRLHSRIVEEGRQKKKYVSRDTTGEPTDLGELDNEFNCGMEAYEYIINQAFKDL